MDWKQQYGGVLKEYARDYIFENTGLKVLALLITAVLWLSVASRPVSQIPFRDVPIELRNIPESPQLVVSKYDTLSAQVYLTGPRDVLDTIRASELVVFADLTNIEPGVRVVKLDLDSSRLPSGVTSQAVEPRIIRLTVEREVEREVPVVPRFEGEPPEGYEIISRNLSPATVHIVGAASHVRDITEVSTETVGLSDRTSQFTEKVAIDVGSPNVTIKSGDPREAVLNLNIGEVRKERVIERVPIIVQGNTQPVQTMPMFVRVTLFGARSAIDAMTPEDVTAIIDYPGSEKQRELIPRFDISPNFSNRVEVRSFEPKIIKVR
jgi:YbbR domain-containing protein